MSTSLAVICKDIQCYSLVLHSIYVTVFSCNMLSTLFLENISFLCHCLKPSYVMTFNVIPGFFLHFHMRWGITSTISTAPPKAGTTSTNFSMLIFLGVENLVDVSHLQPSMLIFLVLMFLMLIPHPLKLW